MAWWTKILKKRSVNATRYDAAANTSESRRHWSISNDGYSADYSTRYEVRRVLRNRSRYETANNSYASGIVLTLADDTIGTGPRPQIISESREYSARTERDFLKWALEIDLGEKLRTMRISKIVDGEAFAIFTNNQKLKGNVKLDLSLIETDRVSTPTSCLDLDNFIDGVSLDTFGNPVTYHVLKHHPGDCFSSFLDDYDIIRAENILHWFRPTRPEQHRGIPELTPALPLFAQLRRYTLAVLASAETAADFAAVIYTDAPAGGESAEAVPFETVNLEKRTATTLPSGWKLGQLKSEQPTTVYSDFKREILGEIGRALQMPINLVTGDSSRHNYASGRLDHQSYQRAIRIEQRTCIDIVLNPIFDAWYREYRLVNTSGQDLSRDEFTVRWFFDGFEHVDPSKEANAQKTKLKNLTTSLSAEYAKAGLDWEEELTQIAREKKLLKELDLADDQVKTP